ncbi:MAG: sugar phosphate isomerase/epimerase family protein [Armatimonadia bacterium]
MRKALNLVTLQRGFDTVEGMRIAAEAGFEGVGLWQDSLAALKEKAGNLDAVTAQPIRVEEMCFLWGWMWPEGEERERVLAEVEQRTALAAEAGSPIIIACAAPGVGDPERAARDFRTVADIGQRYGVVMALEYIGGFEQYHDIKSGLGLVRAADHPYAKLLIDVFHSFRGGTVVEDFKLPRGDEVALVHINDVPVGDILQMNDSHRVLPGEGVLPLREALGYLGDNGYDGALSVEVFSEELWAKPAAEVAARAAAGMEGLLAG